MRELINKNLTVNYLKWLKEINKITQNCNDCNRAICMGFCVPLKQFRRVRRLDCWGLAVLLVV